MINKVQIIHRTQYIGEIISDFLEELVGRAAVLARGGGGRYQPAVWTVCLHQSRDSKFVSRWNGGHWSGWHLSVRRTSYTCMPLNAQRRQGQRYTDSLWPASHDVMKHLSSTRVHCPTTYAFNAPRHSTEECSRSWTDYVTARSFPRSKPHASYDY